MSDQKPLDTTFPMKVMRMEDCGESATVTVEDIEGSQLLVKMRTATARKLSIGGQVVLNFLFPEAAIFDVWTAVRSEGSKAAKTRLLQAEGGCLTMQELLAKFPDHKADYNLLRSTKCLLAIYDGDRYLYPVWQFNDEGRILDGLPLVLRRLAPDDAWVAIIFFLEPHPALQQNDKEVTPLEALREGRVDDVVDAARSWGIQGAT